MVRATIDSEALRANLACTQPKELDLSDEERWLLGICSGHLGLHRRTNEFFTELHHPFPNAALLVEELRTLALGDLWFFASCAQPLRALAVICDAFERAYALGMDAKVRERLLQTVVELIAALLERPQADTFEETLARLLTLLEAVADSELLARLSGWLKRQAGPLGRHPRFGPRGTRLLARALTASLEFWRGALDLEAWLQAKQKQLEGDHSARFAAFRSQFIDEPARALAGEPAWDRLLEIPDFERISDALRCLMDGGKSPFDQARYLLHVARMPGMAHCSQLVLWDLSRVLAACGAAGASGQLTAFVDSVFDDFAELGPDSRGTVLDCILSLGKVIYGLENRELVERFLDRVIRLGFAPPSLAGVDEEWQTVVDTNHVKSIRVWLELIELKPSWSTRLISALIVHLKEGGVFIADTDLFQKDISRLLNARIEPCYKLILQLLRLFPAYFNEIGAEGELREVTTKIDELSHREDRLIHFLRKQVHTESSSASTDLACAVARYWHSGDPAVLDGRLPADVRAWLKPSGRWFDGAHAVVTTLCAELGLGPEALLDERVPRIEELLARLPDLPQLDRERLVYLVRLKQLLDQKYGLSADGVLPQMRRLGLQGGLLHVDDAPKLEKLLADSDPEPALLFVYDLMARLRAIILDPNPTEGDERIYHKRHIAVGIPSMYGSYFEPKFAALGLTFRLERLAAHLLDQMVHRSLRGHFSRRTLRLSVRTLEMFNQGLSLVGVVNEGFSSHLRMLRYSLKTLSFSLTQYINLFEFLADGVKQIIRNYFLRQHEETLQLVLRTYVGRGAGRPLDEREVQLEVRRRSEEFYRDLLASAFLVGPLDAYLAGLLERINTLKDQLRPEAVGRVMGFELESACTPIYEENAQLDNQVFLGAKGYFLKKLHSFGFPIPPGFILTTELFRIRDVINSYPALRKEFEAMVLASIAELERKTGKKLGDPTRPLLLSVRSGSAISMPGAMNTFLNIGLNAKIAEGLSKQPNYGWTSWDCLRRSLQTWGMAYGISRDDFDKLIMDFKRQFGVREKVQFTPAQMRTIALAYQDLLRERGVQFEEDPERQLLSAIMSVFLSWDTERAQVYRRRMRISEEWGTAVVVQAMVLGNIGYDSGTGVLFTKDPHVEEPGVHLWGDFTTTSQGEDVVAGLVHPWPISKAQCDRMPSGEEAALSLETHFPEIYAALLERAEALVHRHGFGHQEIEFTFESSRREDLYILQTRNQVTMPLSQPVFASEGIEAHLLGRGIGIGGGALNGLAAFDMEDLERLAREHPDSPRILIRPDTVPDDIGMIFECDGLLTARGGATSHAAVTACCLGKTCVVNCRALAVSEESKRCIINGLEVRSGDAIAIDGRTGNIFRGNFTIAMSAILTPC